MKKVKFINIGHSNACFEVELKGELTEQFIIENVIPHCGSRNLSAGVNEEHTKGVVYGGFHVIGEFEVLER